MTKKKAWRYYCDHCKKGSLSGGHMAAHERFCTANPVRVCRMHVNYPDHPQKPMAELLAAINTKLPDCGLSALRQLTGGCPMCILATVRQSGIRKRDADPENALHAIDFDFKQELAEQWAIINDAKAHHERELCY